MPPPFPPLTNCASCWKWTCHRCFHDCCRFHRPPHLQDKAVDWPGFLVVFAIKLLLEVCGAAGAVWGSTEVVYWRNADNTLVYRNLALGTFGIFLLRLYWHAKHWLEHEHDFPFVKIHHRRQHLIHFLQVFGAKFLLQVMGATGAIWGCSDAAGLRTRNTQACWRAAAMVTGIVFLVRWVLEIMAYCLLFEQCTAVRHKKELDDEKDDKLAASWSTRMNRWILCLLTVVDWNECLLVKFVLEVCGACGAVWGFSELVGLHTEYTKESIWRPLALAVGAIFALRWLWQTVHFLWFDQAVHLVTEPMSEQKRTSVHLTDRRLHVSASMRRLSTNVMRSSLRALGASTQDLVNDKEECSNSNADNYDIEPGDVEQESVETSSLRPLLVATSDTEESYKSCVSR